MKADNKIVNTISTALVFALATTAFILSFDALRALAAGNGVAQNRSWMFPLAVDGFILVAALAALRANLHGERAWYPTALVLAFTLVSTVLNVAHSNGVLAISSPVLATIVSAVPPTALFLAIELAFAQIRSIVRERIVTESLEDVQARVSELEQLCQEKAQEVKDLDQRSRKLAQRIKDRQVELEQLAQGPESITDALLAFYAGNPLASHAKAGAAVGRSRSWVGQRLAEMEQAGSIKRNGSGVEILKQELMRDSQ